MNACRPGSLESVSSHGKLYPCATSKTPWLCSVCWQVPYVSMQFHTDGNLELESRHRVRDHSIGSGSMLESLVVKLQTYRLCACADR